MRRQRSLAVGLVVATVLALVVIHRMADRTVPPNTISGPYAALLARHLGPARSERIQLTAELPDSAAPVELIDWARTRSLQAHWRPGDRWAILDGPPATVGATLDVAVNDYQGPNGEVFYASPQQPAVPAALKGRVSALGRILGYTPHSESLPFITPLDVPNRGLAPASLLRTYNAQSLRDRGYTGKGVTVLVFAFDGFDQADLDMYATTFGLPMFTPEVLGGMPSERNGEATMDLEAIHAIAPDAKKVLVNARPTVEGDGSYAKIGALMEDADRAYPGAIWSFSIGWSCDKLITATDLVPVRSALVSALNHGSTAFNASGDLAGLECKGGQRWSAPPGPEDIGLDSIASLPEMTDVGGTTLSTDAQGHWLGEQSWFDAPLSQGTGGGVSSLFDRPSWQSRLRVEGHPGRRLTPDVAAVADPFTGMQIIFKQKLVVGGGTSLSAPIWAGFLALINHYLVDRGGRPVGDLNPLLYEIAEGAPLPAFRDVVLGGNAVDDAGPGYDLVTGLGTPDVENLAKNLAAVQRRIGAP
ncbi:MAG: S53 family peptidase [Mycobacterium sp.]|nr:S53 family peptidase [Mycobacterium sp.]